MIQTDGKIIHVLGLGASTVLKWSKYLRQSTDSVQISIKISVTFFFHRARTNNFKICMEMWILTEIWFIYVDTSTKFYYVNQRSCQPLHLTKFFLWLLILPMRILKFRDKKKKKGKNLVTEWRLELWFQILNIPFQYIVTAPSLVKWSISVRISFFLPCSLSPQYSGSKSSTPLFFFST